MTLPEINFCKHCDTMVEKIRKSRRKTIDLEVDTTEPNKIEGALRESEEWFRINEFVRYVEIGYPEYNTQKK
jgi:hypothetical protein